VGDVVGSVEGEDSGGEGGEGGDFGVGEESNVVGVRLVGFTKFGGGWRAYSASN